MDAVSAIIEKMCNDEKNQKWSEYCKNITIQLFEAERKLHDLAIRIKSSQISNNTKTREALSLAFEALSNLGIVDSRIHIGDIVRKANALRAIKAAISIPQRNVDRFDSLNDAMRVFADALMKIDGKVEFGCAEWVAFIRWLDAKAEEGVE